MCSAVLLCLQTIVSVSVSVTFLKMDTAEYKIASKLFWAL